MTDHTTAWAPPTTHCYRLDTGLSRHELSAILLWKKTCRLGKRLQISLRRLCDLWATRLESLSHPLVRDRVRDSICVRRVHVLTASVQRVHMRVHHGGVLGVVHHQGHFLSGAQSFLPLLRQLPADTKKSWGFNKVFFPQTLIFLFYYLLRWYEQGCFSALKVAWERFYSCIISIKVRQMVFGFKAVWSNLHSCCVNTFFSFKVVRVFSVKPRVKAAWADVLS